MAPKGPRRIRNKNFEPTDSEHSSTLNQASSSQENETQNTGTFTKNQECGETDKVRETIGASTAEVEKEKKAKRRRKKFVPPEKTVLDRPVPRTRKPRLESSKKLKEKRKGKIEICESAYLDFPFFEKNGFYWNEFLDIIGCGKLCDLRVTVYSELIVEFYQNLDLSERDMLVSKVLEKEITISRQDLIECFDFPDVNDDLDFVGLNRDRIFEELNDGVKKDYGMNVSVFDFELLVRLLHKMVVSCVLPKKGSLTTITGEDALIIFAILKKKKVDLARQFIRHVRRNKQSMPYGSALMKLFEFKGIELPESSKASLSLKRIGEFVLHHMGIHVKNYLWYANDWAHYIHPSHRKRTFKFGESSSHPWGEDANKEVEERKVPIIEGWIEARQKSKPADEEIRRSIKEKKRKGKFEAIYEKTKKVKFIPMTNLDIRELGSLDVLSEAAEKEEKGWRNEDTGHVKELGGISIKPQKLDMFVEPQAKGSFPTVKPFKSQFSSEELKRMLSESFKEDLKEMFERVISEKLESFKEDLKEMFKSFQKN